MTGDSYQSGNIGGQVSNDGRVNSRKCAACRYTALMGRYNHFLLHVDKVVVVLIYEINKYRNSILAQNGLE